MEKINTLHELEEKIAEADLSVQTKKIKGKDSISFTFTPSNGEWREASFSKEKKTKGKTYKSLTEAFNAVKNRQRVNGIEVSVLVLVSSVKNDEGAMTEWLVADEPEIGENGAVRYETVHIQLTLPELAECDERIAFYDGYYLYPLTKASHCTVGRILGLSGHIDSLIEGASVPVGLGMMMSDAIARRGEVNLVYSSRRRILHKVRPLTGLTLMESDKMLSHRDVFTLFEGALTSKCIWTLAEHEVSETSVKAVCNITYPFTATATFYDGCTPGDGASVGIDIHDGDAVMRAGSASFGHASKAETAYGRICDAVDSAERFAAEYLKKKDCVVEYSDTYAEDVFKCIGKIRKKKAGKMNVKKGAISEIIRETYRIYHTDALNPYKAGKLLEAYAEEAEALMEGADIYA